MKAKFTLSLSEAQWPYYPRQRDEPETEFTVDLGNDPWVQFTYGCLRDQLGGVDFGDLVFGGDGMIHHDGKVYTDLVIEFIPDEEG